eukprot:TRINITY_DN796_c0_g2_i4.p2 TRINITY_DN796_c0_g2~~TRINITY_DN796_c0_g2_i4.p2  ORF type:complete len:262 (+),score=35.34 TRINITY_DN796_c0_g2_i4:1096-1881(+)
MKMVSITGTKMFSAPEMLIDGAYTEKVDIWAAGALLYMLLSGSHPFASEYMHEVVELITKGQFSFDEESWESISREAKDLVQSLLTVKVDQRPSASETLQHDWLLQDKGKPCLKSMSFASIRSYLPTSVTCETTEGSDVWTEADHSPSRKISEMINKRRNAFCIDWDLEENCCFPETTFSFTGNTPAHDDDKELFWCKWKKNEEVCGEKNVYSQPHDDRGEQILSSFYFTGRRVLEEIVAVHQDVKRKSPFFALPCKLNNT